MSNETILKYLNTALQMELSAAHQYQLHAHVLDDWGLDILAEQMRGEFSEEVDHSNRFMTRIFELGGVPEVGFANTPKAAGSLHAMFTDDLKDEKEAIRTYTEASKLAYESNDLKSRALFEEIALEEEGHKEWLELQLSLLNRLGEERYAFKYVSAGADSGDV